MTATSRSRKKKSPVRLRVSRAFAIFLILAGAGLIFWSSFRQGYGWQTPTQAEPQLNQEQTDKEAPKPAKIYIPKLERTLDVSDGFIKDNRWTVSQTGVSYLINSGRLGEPGNVVLYGHNTKDVLGSLWKVQAGDIVEVTDSEGNIHKFEIFERKEVKPNSVEILESTEDSRLTIYTCSGFLDTARFVVVAKKVS